MFPGHASSLLSEQRTSSVHSSILSACRSFAPFLPWLCSQDLASMPERNKNTNHCIPCVQVPVLIFDWVVCTYSEWPDDFRMFVCAWGRCPRGRSGCGCGKNMKKRCIAVKNNKHLDMFSLVMTMDLILAIHNWKPWDLRTCGSDQTIAGNANKKAAQRRGLPILDPMSILFAHD